MDPEVEQLDDVPLYDYVRLPQLVKDSAFPCPARSHTQSPAARNLNRGDVVHRTIFVSAKQMEINSSPADLDSPGLALGAALFGLSMRSSPACCRHHRGISMVVYDINIFISMQPRFTDACKQQD